MIFMNHTQDMLWKNAMHIFIALLDCGIKHWSGVQIFRYLRLWGILINRYVYNIAYCLSLRRKYWGFFCFVSEVRVLWPCPNFLLYKSIIWYKYKYVQYYCHYRTYQYSALCPMHLMKLVLCCIFKKEHFYNI